MYSFHFFKHLSPFILILFRLLSHSYSNLYSSASCVIFCLISTPISIYVLSHFTIYLYSSVSYVIFYDISTLISTHLYFMSFLISFQYLYLLFIFHLISTLISSHHLSHLYSYPYSIHLVFFFNNFNSSNNVFSVNFCLKLMVILIYFLPMPIRS